MRFLSFLALALTTASAPAQEIDAQLSGRLDSSFTWQEPEERAWGAVAGWAGLTGGTPDVKTEVRTVFTNLPEPEIGLSRAWVKFRVPGARFTTGLGRLAWGTGYVLTAGDLLFDAGSVDFQSDELRAQGAWLGDAWLSLGDEAYLEAAVLTDRAGARVSAAPWGVTWEAAASWNRVEHEALAAFSSQFHLGADWYATVRSDRTVAAGAFVLWAPGGGVRLSSRHEAQISGTDEGSLKSYHDASLSFDAGWSLTGRVLVDRAERLWSPSAEARWNLLQNLSVYGVAALKEPWVFRVGVTSKW